VSEQRLTPADLETIAARAESILADRGHDHAHWHTEVWLLTRSVPALLAEVAAVTGERDEARRLLEGLTPGGSEFHDNPQRCAEWARQEISRNIQGRVDAVAARNRAEAELAIECTKNRRLENSNWRLFEMRLETYERADRAEAELVTQQAKVAALRGALLGLRRYHATDCNHHFHSGLSCNCGATKQNAAIDAALAGKEASDANG
jgi:hypothetical protein